MTKKFAPLIIANWKMNGLYQDSIDFVERLLKYAKTAPIRCEVVKCPDFTLLRDFSKKLSNTAIDLGAQNCHYELDGAFTGEISPSQLVDSGCKYVIIGHSERRFNNNESNELIKKKIIAAHKQKLITIVCIGETAQQRDQNLTQAVLRQQLIESLPSCCNAENTVIAYEPVWAIGSGITPANLQISATHEFIFDIAHKEMAIFEDNIRIIYGGSVSEVSAKGLLATPNIDGLLVGKTSLNLEKFYQIVNSI